MASLAVCGEGKMREGAGDNCWLSVSKGEGDGGTG